MAEFRLTPAAVNDLEAIWIYSSNEWGQNQANTYIDELVRALTDLAENPGLAPACNHIRSGYRRLLVGRHHVYFKPCHHGIDVIRILHHRMDAPRHF